MSGVIRLESVIKAIQQKFSGKVADGNIAAATEAYAEVLAEIGEGKRSC
jgi:pyruvate ferredoxin oxidoreductase gamma subunit